MGTYLVKRLEQAKLLTDPFKLTLLGHFSDKPVTTKQVADSMGEKAPRLYRHVDALVQEGLLELVEERPKRGTIERYYRTIAERFEVDPDLFATGSDDADESLEMVRSMLRDTESDLVRLFDEFQDTDVPPDELPMVAKLVVRGTKEEVMAIRGKLETLLQECGAAGADRDDEEELVSYLGLIAFYPQQG
jgi:predicted ArsR family transcriptional regulator